MGAGVQMLQKTERCTVWAGYMVANAEAQASGASQGLEIFEHRSGIGA
jgi:hypothetical protein